MASSTHSDCSPVVRTERLELARLIDVDGRGSRRSIVGFEQDVAWIRCCGAQVVLLHGGRVVKEATAFCDVDRWGNCVDAAVEEALRLCDYYSVTRASSLSFEVVATVEETPVLPPGGTTRRGIFGRYDYERVPEDWMHHDAARIGACLEARANRTEWPEGGFPSLVPVKVVDAEPVWTSQGAAQANARRISGFLSRWTVL